MKRDERLTPKLNRSTHINDHTTSEWNNKILKKNIEIKLTLDGNYFDLRVICVSLSDLNF